MQEVSPIQHGARFRNGWESSSSSEDGDSVSSGMLDTDTASIAPYERWGGLAAAIADTPDFISARQTDPCVADVFARLDLLEQRITSLDGVSSALAESGLTGLEVSRLNSPLLDGLWKLATGSDPAVESIYQSNPASNAHAALLRLCHPRVYQSTAELLLAMDAASQQDNGAAVLCVADAGRVDMLAVLLQHGVGSAAECAPAMRMALRRAVTRGHTDCVRLMLAQMPDRIEAVDLDDCVAIAASHGHELVCLMLLDALDWKDSSVCTALEGAVTGAQLALVQAVVEHARYPPHDQSPELLDRLLNRAASTEHVPLVDYLLSLQRYTASARWAAIRSAACKRQQSVLHALLKYDTQQDLQALNQRLIDATLWDIDLSALQLLLQAGARLNTRNTDMLLHAVFAGRADTVCFLIASGMDVRAQNDAALYLAAATGHAPTVDAILTSVRLQSSVDYVAYHQYVVEGGCAALLAAMPPRAGPAHGWSGENRALLAAQSSGHLAAVQVLLPRTSTFYSARLAGFLNAVSGNHTGVVAYLLERVVTGLPECTQRHVLQPALMTAAEKGLPAMLELLLNCARTFGCLPDGTAILQRCAGLGLAMVLPVMLRYKDVLAVDDGAWQVGIKRALLAALVSGQWRICTALTSAVRNHIYKLDSTTTALLSLSENEAVSDIQTRDSLLELVCDDVCVMSEVLASRSSRFGTGVAAA